MNFKSLNSCLSIIVIVWIFNIKCVCTQDKYYKFTQKIKSELVETQKRKRPPHPKRTELDSRRKEELWGDQVMGITKTYIHISDTILSCTNCHDIPDIKAPSNSLLGIYQFSLLVLFVHIQWDSLSCWSAIDFFSKKYTPKWSFVEESGTIVVSCSLHLVHERRFG